MRETNNRGVAQLVSASGLGPEGPVFESQYPDILQKRLLEIKWPLFLLYLQYHDTGKRNREVFWHAESAEGN